jgi:beta-ribofuranosylaminobenzene 5'-phosphate synthase
MRAYGGCGVSFDGMPAVISGSTCSNGELGLLGFSTDAELDLDAVIKQAAQHELPVAGRYELQAAPKPHVGLGSTTAITLGLLRCMQEIQGWQCSRDLLIEISGRGRTSAIGCNAFFHGGFVIDAGQSQHPTDGTYLPSVSAQGRNPSLHIGTWRAPSSWVVWLLFADFGPVVDPENERKAFEKAAAIDPGYALRATTAVYHGLLPSLIEADLTRFASSLRMLQSGGFKDVEFQLQHASVQNTLRRLWGDGFAAGLSSFGPVSFVVTEAGDELPSWVTNETTVVGPYAFRSRGYDLELPSGPAK